ncbi:hypothetical protein L226DRAFT_279710 [Lentinus tigrinus ALCF2SS1-7]|uniref:DUF6534 domain-containing protein n=1 Tax=Lentinus tigrinus ALCF2SS1-6 TaxID=1328759 RepID=A0A5C2RUX9_9APHY|nr:hypothetical protein L227DRAFT_657656 [Lentinus tigrinus ALCF2SS1-6]RPD69279.1 hypothetical protein L226DRAFT_279710 [Lentinus tigrinus ALCF2SS1-7]
MALPLVPRADDGLDSSALQGASSQFPSLANTYGAYLIGTFFGTGLYGFFVHQLYRYGRLFPTDTLFIRLLVLTVMILETIHVVFTMHTCYYYLTSNYFNPAVLNLGVWSLNGIPVIVGVNMFISQLFFARRVYLIGKHYRFIVAVAMLFFAVEIGFSIGAVCEVIAISTFDSIVKVNQLLAATFGAAIMGDSLLTGSLIWVLRRSRSTETRQVEPFVETLNVYIINTGLLHDILNVVSLIVVLAFPHDLIHGCISIVTTRLYGNTLMAVLNSRKLNLSRGIEVLDGEVSMNLFTRANRLATQERWNVPQVPDSNAPSVINIQVTTEMGGDMDKRMSKNTNMNMDEVCRVARDQWKMVHG